MKNKCYVTIDCCTAEKPCTTCHPVWIRTVIVDTETRKVWVPTPNFNNLSGCYIKNGCFCDMDNGVWYLDTEVFIPLISDKRERNGLTKMVELILQKFDIWQEGKNENN